MRFPGEVGVVFRASRPPGADVQAARRGRRSAGEWPGGGVQTGGALGRGQPGSGASGGRSPGRGRPSGEGSGVRRGGWAEAAGGGAGEEEPRGSPCRQRATENYNTPVNKLEDDRWGRIKDGGTTR